MNQNLIKALTAIGSILLLITAYQHFEAVDLIKDIAAKIDDPILNPGLVPLWIHASVHILFIALLAFGASFYRSKACAAFLLGFGIWVLVIALISWTYVGWFKAIPMLLVAAVLYLISGFMLRRSAHSQTQ